ncbi:MAG: hypothetical protein ABIQ15_12545 [Nocardioides sp.]
MSTWTRITCTALVTSALGLVALLTPPGATAVPVSAPAAAVAAAKPTMILRLTIAHCDGCSVTATSVLRSDYSDTWTSVPRAVVDGQVRLEVPKSEARGLTIALDAPWEGRTGYQTMIAMRYQGKAPGDVVTLAQARAARRASGCWAGSAGDKVAMTIGVRQVQVPGNGGMVDGTIAWAKVTQEYLFPMDQAPGGVLGTQDVIGCGTA